MFHVLCALCSHANLQSQSCNEVLSKLQDAGNYIQDISTTKLQSTAALVG